MSGTFSSFQFKNVRTYVPWQSLNSLGSWMRQVALILLVLRLTDDGVAVGVVSVCQFLPMVLFGLWSGLVADRTEKRRLLMYAQVVVLCQSVPLVLLATMDSPPLLGLYATALVSGIAGAFDLPARRALIAELVPESHVQNAVGLNLAVQNGARVVAPALAGLLIGTVGFAWCFALDAVSTLLFIWALMRIDPSTLRRPPPAARRKGQIREGIRYVRGVPAVWTPIVMTIFIGAFPFNHQVLIPLFVRWSLHRGDTAITLVFSVVSIGALFGALWTAGRKMVEVRHVIVAGGAIGVAAILLSASPNIAVAFPAAFALGAASVCFITLSTSLVQLRTDPLMQGRVIALHALVTVGGLPLGGPIIGAVSDLFGARAAVAGCGGMCFVAVGVAAVRNSRAIGVLDPSSARPASASVTDT